ncbi:MAG: tripartite tricarboxylate transporter substrate binding protein [Pseudomonadota bacterium]
MSTTMNPSLDRRGLLRLAALAGSGALPFAAPGALAAPAAFPNKPLHIVVPFAPGGGTDLVARLVAEGMGKDLGQPAIVDNKPGAGTIIGTDFVAKAPADGTTLVMATFAHAVNPSLMAKLPFNPEKDFAPVALIGTSPNVLVVRPDRPYKTVRDIIAAAQAAPGKLTYGSFGNGTSAHLAGALFANLAKVDITHVPYKGSAPAITDLLGGQIDMMFTTVASVAQHIAGGKLRAVAVTSAQRSPAWPDVPTIAEAGVPGYRAESWYGLYAPAATPAATIARLNAAVKQAVKSDTFRSRVESEGLVTSAGAPAELDRYVHAEIVRWRKVVHDAHITVD